MQEDDATTVAMKNSWMSTSSAIFSISGTSFTNSRSYPVFIVGRSNAGGGSFSFTVSNLVFELLIASSIFIRS